MHAQRDAWLVKAIEHHKAGTLVQATECYERALAGQPNFPASQLAQIQSNYGAVLQALGRHAEALIAYDSAISIEPAYAQAHNNRGVLLGLMGLFQEAVNSYSRAVQIEVGYAQAYFNQGVALQSMGQPAAALLSYENAVAANPAHAQAHNNRSNVLQEVGRLAEALQSYEQAIANQPDYAEAFYGMGMVLLSQKHMEAAALCLEQAIAYRSDFAQAHCMLGALLQESGKLDAAISCLLQALRLDPALANAHGHLGVICQTLGRDEDAIFHFRAAVDSNPKYVGALVNLGNLLCGKQEPLEALGLYERAIDVKVDFAEAHYNRGRALEALDRLDDALQSYAATLSIDPAFKEAHYNTGVVLQRQARIAQALQAYESALNLDPEYPVANWNRANAKLQLGQLREGFEGYEWRWQVPGLKDAARNFVQPVWLGEIPLQGKTIVLFAEQGLGDTLHMCRYVPIVAARAGKVIVIVQKPLLSIFKHMERYATFLSNGDVLPNFDCYCPLLSLPLAFKTDLATIPAAVPYLSVGQEKMQQWSFRLGSPRRARVGLVWSGNADHKNDQNRSIALHELLHFLPTEVDYFSLQKEVRPADRRTLDSTPHIQALDAELESFEDTAAVASLMDLVISVDTSVAHLCGALNIPVWILIPLQPDWRWMLERTDSPWYPSAYLWRQDRLSDWSSTLARMGAQFARNLAARMTTFADVPVALSDVGTNGSGQLEAPSRSKGWHPATATVCPVCASKTRLFDVVDFNKSCEEGNGLHLPLAGVAVYYARCDGCGFCFAPEMCAWSQAEFSEKVYNADYAQVDPDYLEHRPLTNAGQLQLLSGGKPPALRHLDYGGGNGLLSRTLQAAGWNSASYDPFANPDVVSSSLGRFELITAFEVFEHVPDPQALLLVLKDLLAADGAVYFSTLLSDGEIIGGGKLNWWYAAPRNGHISLYTRESLSTLGRRYGLKFLSLSPVSHLFISGTPKWAAEVFNF
jgi:tetratricopeptide (TPR) repeat protein/SAM-dependent methyltransferase